MLGSDTVTFVSIAVDRTTKSDRGRPSKPETPATQTGCSVQPWIIRDKVSDTEFSEATDKFICPVSQVTLACKAEDRLEFLGDKYRVIGTKVWRRRNGQQNHVTIYAQAQHG